MHTKMSVKSVSVVGLLVAMEIILARFSIHTWNIKIGFSFVPIVVAAIFYGPIAGGLVGAIGDVISAVLFPVGAYFPGFTLTAFLTGAVFGWFFRKKVSLGNVILSVLIAQVLISQVMNTYWISFLYGSPFWLLFLTRIYQTAGMFVVQTAGIMLIEKKLMPVLRKYEMM
ncbi:MAG: folate family ECF transporter S component [Eubacterium sp.]|jgi:ECF transporter S component (folate family)|nr:folate family ECF transporter S component [Eubacterium sp.]